MTLTWCLDILLPTWGGPPPPLPTVGTVSLAYLRPGLKPSPHASVPITLSYSCVLTLPLLGIPKGGVPPAFPVLSVARVEHACVLHSACFFELVPSAIFSI